MSFAAEMKDFFSAFKAMKDTRSESEYRKAVSDYYRGGKGGKGSLYGYGEDSSSKSSGGLFGKLGSMFGGDDEKDPYEGMSDLDVAAKKLKDAEGRALRDGNVPVVKKLQDDARDLRDRFGLGKKSGGGGSSKPAEPAKAIPEAPTGENPDFGKPSSDEEPIWNLYKRSRFNDARSAEDEPANKVAYLEDDPFGVDELGAPREPQLDTVVRAATGGAIPEGDELDEGYDEGYDEETDVNEPEADDDADDMISDRMSELAMPGVAAGLRYMSARVQQPQSQQAIPEADMPAQDGTEAIARNVGAATPEEITAFNKIIDPEGRLPERSRSAARIAAVWDMYGEKDPNKAERMINSLMLYDKKNSQTRGAIAMQAYQEGDLESATRAIADAWNEDIPSNVHIQPAVLEDGNVAAKIIKGGQVVDEKKMSAQEFGGLIQKVASGSAYLDNTLSTIQEMSARSDAGRSARSGGAAPLDASVMKRVLLAKRAFEKAKATMTNTPAGKENLRRMQENLDAAEADAIEYASKQKNPIAILKALGIGGVPSSVVTSKGKSTAASSGSAAPKLSEAERKELAKRAEIEGVNELQRRAQVLEEAGSSVDKDGNVAIATGARRGEAAAVEAARRSLESHRGKISNKLADTGYNQVDDVKSYADKGYDERIEPITKAFNEYLTRKSPVDGKPIKLSDAQMDMFPDLADRIARKNDVNPRRIIEFLDKAANDPSFKLDDINSKTGAVRFGNNELFVDGQTLAFLAQQRGERMRQDKLDHDKTMNGPAIGPGEPGEYGDTWVKEAEGKINRSARESRRMYDDDSRTSPNFNPRSALPVPDDLRTPKERARQPELDREQFLRDKGYVPDYKRREEEMRRKRDLEDDAR